MKSEITNTGWKLTTVKHITATRIAMYFNPIKEWVAFTKKYKYTENSRNSGRFRCECCRTPWDVESGDSVHLVQCKGTKNQVICTPCCERLIEEGIPFHSRKVVSN